MKETSRSTKAISIFLAGLVLLTSCESMTMIQSSPSGAKVYMNGEIVGKTPYEHWDTKFTGSTTSIILEKEGFQPFNTSITRDEAVDVGAVIGGCFFLFPFIWTMKYKNAHNYELIPLQNASDQIAPNQISTEVQQLPEAKSKVTRLRELKQLLDDKIVTQAEFESEKAKILGEN